MDNVQSIHARHDGKRLHNGLLSLSGSSSIYTKDWKLPGRCGQQRFLLNRTFAGHPSFLRTLPFATFIRQFSWL